MRITARETQAINRFDFRGTSMTRYSTLRIWAIAPLVGLLAVAIPSARCEEPKSLELRKGDRVVVIGNTLAERMQYFGNFESLLHARFPEHELVVRNLGWSADELTLRPRSAGFQDHGHTLRDHKPDVILAFFGFNESFAGAQGVAKFKADLENFINETTTTAYNGKEPPRLVLVGPIAHENLKNPHITDGARNNANIELYSNAMAEVAASKQVLFANLFKPTRAAFEASSSPLTINGIHLNEQGDAAVARLLEAALFGESDGLIGTPEHARKLKDAVNEKNLQFFYDYRATNGCYIYGGRKTPFGVVNFPAEFAKLRKMTEKRDQRIWAIAQGKVVPDNIDDSDTGTLVDVVTNAPNAAAILSPEEERKTFKLPEGYEISLFASEVEFPDLRKPVQMTFDARGRLWVCTMPSYPMYLPGTPPDDKVLIFEDTNKDGKADKCTTFADKLHVPTGLEFGNGGLYVSQQPNLMFLKDTNGDDKADTRSLVMHGFDSADSHHAMHTFVYDPGGALYWQEGTFHHTQVETPNGPKRIHDAGVFRYEPRTEKFDVYVSYPFANPWGHYFDRWGQDFVADASGGANYYATAFSGDIDYPDKRGGMEQFLKMQWRPTCGCELVSSRNFPEESQGDYLLNNNIGFQGILRYRMKEDGSGFHADPIEPLLRSSDPCFRPVDLEFGPDGALYVVDWFNPLVGHMQHSLRDPNRDTRHGRIWRIVYTGKALVEPAKIDGASIVELLDLLKAYEDRTRYRARIALWQQPTTEILPALKTWIANLDSTDKEYWRHMLEALWLHQALDEVDTNLLAQVLSCPEPKARAAATRVLGYWRDRLENPIEWVRSRLNDQHPRVRLESVRALSFFRDEDVPKAQEAALEILQFPLDYYLEYTLNETNKTLDRRAKALEQSKK
jgi:glucose/arabinose dehydrogenase